MSELPGPGDPDPGTDEPVAPLWVSELLASLPGDDPAIPEHVAARLDAALSVLTPAARTSAAATTPTTTPTRAPSPTPVEAQQAEPHATVLPLDAGSRRRVGTASPSRFGHRLLLGGVAAAAVVILGGLSTIAILRAGSSPGSTPAIATGPSVITSPVATTYLASSNNFTAATLATGARSLLAQSGRATKTVTGNETTPAAIETKPATVRPSAGCLSELTGSVSVMALVADETTYERTPVFVVLAPTVDPTTAVVDTTRIDVWVVGRSCSAADAAVIAFQRIDR
jgi:hypothetical protein